MEKTKKTFQAPHTFVILVGLIILASLATYIIPAGEFTRYVDEATGRTIVEAGSYVPIESNPISLLSVPGLVYRAIVKAASTVTFILMIGGSFEIINETGALTALCKRLSRMFQGKEVLVDRKSTRLNSSHP